MGRTSTDYRKYAKYLLILLIGVYPFAGAFLGLDLGDTGYHLYAYKNLLSHPDKINYTTYFSTVIGFVWDKLFGWGGLLAFNFLEVLLEWAACFIVCRTLKKELGELTALAGCLISVIAADTYLNIFNYHQLNAFLVTAILCLELRAIWGKNVRLSFYAGLLYTLLVFSRVGSVTAVITLILYFYNSAMNGEPWRESFRHVFAFAGGAAACAAAFLLGLVVTGRLTFFINNIFRLKDIASGGSSYGFKSLLRQLVTDNLHVIASGLIFYSAALILFCAVNFVLKSCRTGMERLVSVLFGSAVGLIALYQMRYAYDVNPAERWPQVTTGPRFVLGVLYVTAFLCYMGHAFRDDTRSQRLTLLVGASLLLILLTIAGSNTGTKHIVLAMWLIAPVCIYTIRRLMNSGDVRAVGLAISGRTGLRIHPKAPKIALILCLLMFFFKFGHMVYYTFNYDSVNRTQLTATVDNPRVKGILTTKRQADSLNGVLRKLEGIDSEQPLMVFGGAQLFYYMAERDSYGMPWITQPSYPKESYAADLAKAAEEYGDTLPVVIYCRTNYAYGFDRNTLRWNQRDTAKNEQLGKKKVFLNFLEEHDYRISYKNSYFAVLEPGMDGSFEYVKTLVCGKEEES